MGCEKFMVEKSLDNFDISQICNSGQCFRMGKKLNNMFWVIAGDKYLEVSQKGRKCTFYCTKQEFEGFWKHYFDLDTAYEEYVKSITPKDTYLKNAAEFGSGIRILNQDLWEMIVSFLISQQNNIARIRKCIQNICEKYGEEKKNKDGEIYYAFPAPEVLAQLDEDELKACNLGYRSKYVVRTAKSVATGVVSLQEIRELPYIKAKEELLKFFGVGEKVADCICLFALHKMEAFPVDTHINQALTRHYPKGFPKHKYRGFEGVIQQYIFYYELLGGA